MGYSTVLLKKACLILLGAVAIVLFATDKNEKGN